MLGIVTTRRPGEPFWPALVLGAAAFAAGAAVGDEAQQFRAAKRAVASKARSRVPAHRIAAIRELEQYPLADSARLIVQIGLRCADPDVRSAACKALRELAGSQEVCDCLLATLRREARTSAAGVAGAIVAALLASDLSQVQSDLRDFLDDHLATKKTGIALISVVATDLADQGDAPAVASLVKLTRLQYFAGHFGFRRGVVQALISIRVPEAVDALIQLLARVRGEVRGDIVNYLSAISGEEHGLDAPAWGQWWSRSRSDFEFPEDLAERLARVLAAGAPIDYYGIPIYADRMVFVVDISGSMAGPRLMAAQRELIEAIDGLDPEKTFNVVVYSSRAAAWQNLLAPAAPAVKQTAARYISGLTAGGTTASFDALETAFRFDTEAIYFLSDGAPSAGKIVDPAGIIAFVSRVNRYRRISIYSIGIMPGPPGSPLAQFMQTLAEQNFGVYRQVDN
jgi:hypothetical protein